MSLDQTYEPGAGRRPREGEELGGHTVEDPILSSHLDSRLRAPSSGVAAAQPCSGVRVLGSEQQGAWQWQPCPMVVGG